MTGFSDTVKQRGYRRHEELADLLGQGRYQSGYRCLLPVILDDGRLVELISTTNAGFRGIEGWFRDPALAGAFTLNLGHVAVLEPAQVQNYLELDDDGEEQ